MVRGELPPEPRLRRLLPSAASALTLILIGGCGGIPDYRTLTEVDLHPPEFLGTLAVDARSVALRFDEAVVALPESVSVTPDLDVSTVEARGEELVVTLSSDQQVGTAYTIEASVEDESKNSTSVVTRFYGYNPELPEMCINEFTTQGSGKHPDLVELFVGRGGNTAGMCLYEGMPGNWDERIVLPAISVRRGDFLIVHFRPEGLPEEVDEITGTESSGGLDASPAAYDLWVPGGSGLSGNNGVLSLYSCPGGTILDAVVYSNRTSQSDVDYGGFGSRDVYERVSELESCDQWAHTGEHIAPEDAVNPDPSTSTRSISRTSTSGDSDSRADWHITPTGGATFGGVNTDEVYEP